MMIEGEDERIEEEVRIGGKSLGDKCVLCPRTVKNC